MRGFAGLKGHFHRDQGGSRFCVFALPIGQGVSDFIEAVMRPTFIEIACGRAIPPASDGKRALPGSGPGDGRANRVHIVRFGQLALDLFVVGVDHEQETGLFPMFGVDGTDPEGFRQHGCLRTGGVVG